MAVKLNTAKATQPAPVTKPVPKLTVGPPHVPLPDSGRAPSMGECQPILEGRSDPARKVSQRQPETKPIPGPLEPSAQPMAPNDNKSAAPSPPPPPLVSRAESNVEKVALTLAVKKSPQEVVIAHRASSRSGATCHTAMKADLRRRLVNRTPSSQFQNIPHTVHLDLSGKEGCAERNMAVATTMSTAHVSGWGVTPTDSGRGSVQSTNSNRSVISLISDSPQPSVEVKSKLGLVMDVVWLLIATAVLLFLVGIFLKNDHNSQSFFPIRIGIRFWSYSDQALDWLT